MVEVVSQEPPAVDPDNVPETLCVGKFNVTGNGPLAMITFTHMRPKAGPLIDQGQLDFESVVRARIVTTHDNIVALRDLLNTIVPETDSPAPGGTGKPN